MQSKWDFKEFLKTIISLGTGHIYQDDKKLLVDLLSTLRFYYEFLVLGYCYDNNPALQSLLSSIDVKAAKYKAMIDELERKRDTVGFDEFDHVKLKARKLSYDRCQELRRVILDRDFKHYTAFMNQQVDSANQIMAICASALANVEIDYAKEFEISGKKCTVLDVIDKLRRDKKLCDELNTFYTREKKFSVDGQSLEQDKKFLDYIRKVKENEALVRRYRDTLIKSGVNSVDEDTVLHSRISRNKLELENLNNGILSNLRNSREKYRIESQIERDEKDLKSREENRPLLREVEVAMKEAGLESISRQYRSATSNTDQNVEQRVIDFIKLAMTKNSFEIKAVEANLEEKINSYEKRLDQKATLVDAYRNSMSPYAQEIVDKYHDEGDKIIDIINNNVKGAAITPLLSAYVLKALFDAKQLTFEDYKHISNTSANKAIDYLIEGFNAIVNNTVDNLRSYVDEMDERVPFDVNAFDAPKIL